MEDTTKNIVINMEPTTPEVSYLDADPETARAIREYNESIAGKDFTPPGVKAFREHIHQMSNLASTALENLAATDTEDESDNQQPAV